VVVLIKTSDFYARREQWCTNKLTSEPKLSRYGKQIVANRGRSQRHHITRYSSVFATHPTIFTKGGLMRAQLAKLRKEDANWGILNSLRSPRQERG
jgi:hypothetical protein